MKPKKSSPPKSELGKIDFVPKSKEDNLIIGLEGEDVKRGLESAMTILFQSLAEIHRLQREAREGKDG